MELNTLSPPPAPARTSPGNTIRSPRGRGNKRAAVATAHALLVAIYHIGGDQVFADPGGGYADRQRSERTTQRLVRRLNGYPSAWRERHDLNLLSRRGAEKVDSRCVMVRARSDPDPELTDRYRVASRLSSTLLEPPEGGLELSLQR